MMENMITQAAMPMMRVQRRICRTDRGMEEERLM